MNKLLFIVGGIIIITLIIFALVKGGQQINPSVNSPQEGVSMNQKTYSSFPGVLPDNERLGKTATVETSLGNFTLTLYGDKAPKTVSNFIFLSKNGFYDNLTFHRVIAGFMIQGGDPKGDGTGGPGYKFEDEFDPSLTFAKAGVLAMANAGPNTNGSQFFITVAPYESGDNHYSIFGQVATGFDVVEKIATVKTDQNDRPLEPVVIKKITIQ